MPSKPISMTESKWIGRFAYLTVAAGVVLKLAFQTDFSAAAAMLKSEPTQKIQTADCTKSITPRCTQQ